MSRIGKNPITIMDGVTLNISNSDIDVQGPKGKLSLKLRPEIKLEQKDNLLTITRKQETKLHKSIHGLYRALINNMVIGVTKGFSKTLEIIGTGYKANVDGKRLVLNIGYSNPYYFQIPEELKISVENNTIITIEGIDKQVVGEAASVIRKMRPPEPYKGKGIKYKDEVIRRKAGKAT